MFLDNAVLRRELLTSLRTRRAFVLLALFLGVLGGAILLGWPQESVISNTEQKAISRTIFRYFMMGAVLMVSMMAPAFSAGAITMEKEKRSMDLLLASPLSPAAIVIGKFGASMGYLLLLLFATLPLLSLCVMMPGVEPDEVISVYVILIAAASTFGMAGLTASSFFDRTHASLAVTYMLVLPASIVLLLLSRTTDAFFSPGSAIAVAIMAGVACLLMYAVIASRMRRPFEPDVAGDEEQELARQAGLVISSEQFPDKILRMTKRGDFLPDGCNPVFQKELRTELFGKGVLFLRLIIQISSVMTIGFVWPLFIGWEWVFVGYLMAFSMLVGPAFASGAFTQERERGTRDMLLCTLVTPRQVVIGKFCAAARSALMLTGLFSMPLALALIFAREHFTVVHLFLHMLVIATSVLGATTIAMAYSAYLHTTSQSMIMSYLTILVLYLGPVVLGPAVFQLSRVEPVWIEYFSVTSPFAASSSVAKIDLAKGVLPVTWIFFLIFYFCLSAALLLVIHRRYSMMAKGRLLVD